MIQTLKKVDEQTLTDIAEEKKIRKTNEIFLLFSLGSQFDHLIKQMLEKLGVYCLVADPGSVFTKDVLMINPNGIILSGGPVSVGVDDIPFDSEIFDLGIHTLGICLGFQLWTSHIGCRVISADKREFGTHSLKLLDTATLFRNCADAMPVLESHGDHVSLDSNTRLEILASTENAPIAAGHHKNLWGVQFHPEVTETTYGEQIFRNFCFDICGAKDVYPATDVASQKIMELREKIGDQKVLLALSGGSDSSTVAHLLKKALVGKNDQLHGVYIKGIDRPDDEFYVLKYFGNKDWITLHIVDATDMFLQALHGHESFKSKRVAMRGIYKTVIEEKLEEIGAKFIAQGTLYTDISESGLGYASQAKKAQIKLHHNVSLDFSAEELTPLDDCVKDSGRNIGRSIGVPEDLLIRHPFPGPGLVVRVEGEITAEKLEIARNVDAIYIEELRKADLYRKVWQAGAVVTKSVTTWTKGDDAGIGYVIALWAVWSVNGFTAKSAQLPSDFLARVAQRITNEVHGVGSVVYRISDKPPSTIEWG